MAEPYLYVFTRAPPTRRNDTGRGRDAALDEINRGEFVAQGELPEAGQQWFDPENFGEEIGGRGGGPTVAETAGVVKVGVSLDRFPEAGRAL